MIEQIWSLLLIRKMDLNVSSKEFKKNKDKYFSLSSNKVICIDVKTGKKLQVTREKFISNPDFVGIAKGILLKRIEIRLTAFLKVRKRTFVE